MVLNIVAIYVMDSCVLMEIKVALLSTQIGLIISLIDGAPNYYPNSFNGPVDEGKCDIPIMKCVSVVIFSILNRIMYLVACIRCGTLQLS